MGTYPGARTNSLRPLLPPHFAKENMVSLQTRSLFSSVKDLSIAAGGSGLERIQKLVSGPHIAVYTQVSTLAVCRSSY